MPVNSLTVSGHSLRGAGAGMRQVSVDSVPRVRCRFELSIAHVSCRQRAGQDAGGQPLQIAGPHSDVQSHDSAEWALINTHKLAREYLRERDVFKGTRSPRLWPFGGGLFEGDGRSGERTLLDEFRAAGRCACVALRDRP
jgi:hypothetical protein